MDQAHEGDPRSPKRHAQGSASKPFRSAASVVADLDDAIWISIVEFVPIPKDLIVSDEKKHEAAVADVAVTWRTLLHLRLVSKKLAALLHPTENGALWRRLVLQSFDFSTHHSFNVENYKDDHGLDVPSDEEESEEEEDGDEADGDDERANEESDEDEEEDEDEEDGDEEEGKTEEEMESETEEPNGVSTDSEENEETDEEADEDPQLVAMRGRYHDMPSEYLEEDLVSWGTLGIYHRPSQYGFLTTLQQQPLEGEWPEAEDAFTLFGDLVRLLQLPSGKGMCDGGEGSCETFKYLAAPAEADSSSPFHRIYVMKTLGYVPHFWHWGRGIGEKWDGFIAEPDAFVKPVAEHNSVEKEEEEDSEDDEECDEEDEDSEEEHAFEESGEFDFPSCTVRDAKRLYRHIRLHCRDYRSVCCNNGFDGSTPVFFVAESKAAPHRWTGYAGSMCWT